MSTALGAGYILEERIGQGASGEVWRGSRRSDGHEFAFKLLRPQLLSDSATVARFLQERSTLTGLPRHPNLVHIYDLVAEGEQFGIVMDLVQGPDLRRELNQRHTLPAGDALVIAKGVLTGLATLHAAGVVHRDVKPENVLLDPAQGSLVPRLTDYGTARLVAEAAVTRTTAVIGTPDYLAPELADRGAVSAGVDVYSAGVMLYELLCGVTPFGGGLPVAVLRRHIEQLPGRPDHIDDRLWDLLSRMLAKQPAQRPLAQLAASECGALAQVLVGAPALPQLTAPPAPPPTTPGERTDTQEVPRTGAKAILPQVVHSKRRLLLIAAGALVVLLALIGVIIATTRPGPQVAVPPVPATTDAATPASATTPTPTPTPTSTPSATSDASPATESPTPSATPVGACIMPDFTTGTVIEAREYLSGYGITPTETTVDSDTAGDGDVTSQKPAKGNPCSKSVTLGVARFVPSTWLSDLEIVDEEGDYDNVVGPADMDDKTYQHSVSMGDPGHGMGDLQAVEFAIPRSATRLSGRIGLSDDSKGRQPVQIKVIDQDNRTLLDKTVRVGDTKSLSNVKLTNDLRLRFEARSADRNNPYPDVVVVLADVKVIG